MASSGEDIERRVLKLSMLLTKGPAPSDELLGVMKLSQATFSRTIQQVPGIFMFRVKSQRTPRYGIIRRLAGDVSGQQQVYRIGADGVVARAGSITLL